jgi:hypothetical protein
VPVVVVTPVVVPGVVTPGVVTPGDVVPVVVPFVTVPCVVVPVVLRVVPCARVVFEESVPVVLISAPAVAAHETSSIAASKGRSIVPS